MKKNEQATITKFPFNGYNGDRIISYGDYISYLLANNYHSYKMFINNQKVDQNLKEVLSYILFLKTRYKETENRDKNSSIFIDDTIYALNYGVDLFIEKEVMPEPIDLAKFLGIKKQYIYNYPYLKSVIDLILYSKGYESNKNIYKQLEKHHGNKENILFMVYQAIEELDKQVKVKTLK